MSTSRLRRGLVTGALVLPGIVLVAAFLRSALVGGPALDPPSAGSSSEAETAGGGGRPEAPSLGTSRLARPSHPVKPSSKASLQGGTGSTSKGATEGSVGFSNLKPAKAFSLLLRGVDDTNRGVVHRIEGQDGSFSCPGLAPGLYAIRDVIAEGQAAYPWRGDLRVEAGRRVVIRLARRPGARLLVRSDQSSEAPPRTVAVEAAYCWELGPSNQWVSGLRPEEQERWIPSPRTLAGTTFHADASGCIQLPIGKRDRAWLVGAPGYSWERVVVGREETHEIPVALEPAGDVLLSVPGWSELQRPGLFCRRLVENPTSPGRYRLTPGKAAWPGFRPTPVSSETIHLSGLPIGTLLVGVGELIDDASGIVLATGKTEVVAGRENRLRVPVADPRRAEGIAPRGTIHVPRGYTQRNIPWRGSRKRWTAWLYGDSRDKRTRGRRALVRLGPGFPKEGDFTIDPITEGGWTLRLEPVGWRWRFDVEPDMAPLELEVPPPVRVKILVTCAATGQVLADAHVRHIPKNSVSVPSAVQMYAGSSEPGVYWSTCPAGLTEFDATARGYQHTSQRVEVTPGEIQTVELRLPPAGRIRVTLRSGRRPVPVEGMLLRYRPKERGGNTLHMCFGDEEVCGGLSAGTYVVSPDKLPGFKKPEPKEVDVQIGGITPVEFNLEPEAAK